MVTQQDLSTDVKVRTTVQDSNTHSGSGEYVKFNKIEKWNHLSYL